MTRAKLAASQHTHTVQLNQVNESAIVSPAALIHLLLQQQCYSVVLVFPESIRYSVEDVEFEITSHSFDSLFLPVSLVECRSAQI